jgi:hypothetical protein
LSAFDQILPATEAQVVLNIMIICELGTPFGIGFCHGDKTYFARMGKRVPAVRMCSSLTCAYQHKVYR